MPLPAGKPAAADLVAADRRSHPRMRVSGTAIVRPADHPKDPGIMVALEDISEGGISFCAPAQIRNGTRISLEMQPRDASAWSVRLEAEIRWVASNLQTGQSRCGCAWTRPMTSAELKKFC